MVYEFLKLLKIGISGKTQQILYIYIFRLLKYI